MSGFQTVNSVTSSPFGFLRAGYTEKSEALCLELALIMMPQISRLRYASLEMTKESEVRV